MQNIVRHCIQCMTMLTSVGLLACGVLAGPEATLSIDVTDARVDGEGIIRASHTIRNASEHSVWLPTCDDVVSTSLELAGADGWELYGGGYCRANLSQAPVVLLPGEEIATEAAFVGGQAGRYRLLLVYTIDGITGDWRVVSDEFTLP
jgi:hypothetical protein